MTTYRRFIRFRFFTIEEEDKNGNSEYIDIIDWISKFKRKRGFNQICELNNFKYTIQNPVKGNDLWFFRVTRARENDSAVIIANDDYKDIPLNDDEYLGEDMQFLYDPYYNIAMVQSSMFSLSVDNIESIINDTYGYNNSGKCKTEKYIRIKPIISKESLLNYKNNIKSVELSIANKNITFGQSTSSLSSAMKSLISPTTNRLKLELTAKPQKTNSKGEKEEQYLETTDMEELAKFIEENEESISIGRAKVKLDNERSQDPIDLIGGVANTIIPFSIEKKKSLAFEFAISEMERKYNSMKGKVSKLIPRTNKKKE